MREIDINDFYTSININQMTQYFHSNQNIKEREKWTPIPIFPIAATNSWTCFLFNNCNHKKFQQTLLFCFLFSESFTWLFNCSLWVWYPSLETNYYFWQCAFAVEKSSIFHNYCLPELLLASSDYPLLLYYFAIPSRL